MALTVTLVGSRHTDGTEGRLSLVPRGPWKAEYLGQTKAPGPFYFKITASGELRTLAGGSAVVVPTYDSAALTAFTPAGSSYLAKINISGQQIIETWTIDAANATVNWAALGVKPNATDKITVSLPLTTESPVVKYLNFGDLPAGNHQGRIAYVITTGGFYGNNGVAWVRLD